MAEEKSEKSAYPTTPVVSWTILQDTMAPNAPKISVRRPSSTIGEMPWILSILFLGPE